MSKLTLVLGGIKSGKSNFAQNLAMQSKTVTYLATANETDEEMKERIAKHKKNRPAHWQTIEMSQKTLGECLDACNTDTAIIDCLGNFISNRLDDHNNLVKEVTESFNSNRNRFEQLIIVSNEVGLSLVSPYKSGRDFSDTIGLLNQKIAAIADSVYFLAAGIPMKIK